MLKENEPYTKKGKWYVDIGPFGTCGPYNADPEAWEIWNQYQEWLTFLDQDSNQ